MSFSRKHFLIFLGAYIIVRLFSYFWGPETPLQPQTWVNTLLASLYLITTTYFLIRKNVWGWCLVALELILGGAGGFLSIGPFSLRTCLLVISMGIFDVQKATAGVYIKKLRDNAAFSVILTLLFVIVGISAWRGYANGHSLQLIFSDSLPYLFLLYFYPLRELWQLDKFKQISFNALIAAIIGNTLFIALTLIGFASKIFILQDSYYHWYRDVGLGKITELGLGFYRLVLNEHLLLAPILLYFLWLAIKNFKFKYHGIMITALLFILSVNLTRIYFLATMVSSLILIRKDNWKKWIKVSMLSIITFVIVFSGMSLLVSRGQSLGWELFGLRFQGIARPSSEESALSRMLLLPVIWEKIKVQPILGQGLGDQVTVWSPVLKKEITTPHFDWGYLEIWTELGIVGLLIWLIFLLYILKITVHKSDFAFSGIVALMIINITSPAVFHLLGILILAVIASQFDKKIEK